MLTISQSGILEGSAACDIDQLIPLIPDSDKLNLHIHNVAGEFNVDLLTRNFDFDIQLDSDLRFNMSENESWGVWTQLGLSIDGLRLIDSRMDDVAIPKIDLEQFKIGIKNFNLGRLGYNSTPDADGNSGWDFEFGMDLDLEFPEFGMDIPNIPNVTLNRTGFHTMDRISIPSFPDSLGFEFQGIELKPLAFRMPQLNFNWFNPLGGGDGTGWDFDIDFEINFPNLAGASGSMRYPHLTMLGARFINGKIIGSIDWLEFDLLDELKLNFGEGFGFSVTGLSGRLFDDNNSQGIGFDFKGHLDLPEYLRCDGEQTSIDLSETVFSLNSNGQIAGVVNNFVPRCPVDLGFGHFQITSSSINFAFADSGQVAILDMTGDLVVNTGDGNTVTANGVLQMDLLTGQIIDGSITIEEQFVWAIPNDKPVLRFTINRAVLDRNGLTINGDSNLLLPGGETRNARFENFNYDFRKFKVNSGRVEINADFAIKIALEDGEVIWSVISADTPLTENQTAKIGFTSNLILDANGLSTSGEAIAAIRWDDNPEHQFGNLKIRYTNDFKFSIRPFTVSEGRADLIHVQGEAENIIATLTHDGLNLGDIFGLIPLPEIIPLPDRDIAYLRIKSGDRVLVQSETIDGNFHIISTAARPAALVIPSLKQDGVPVDSIDALFDIVISPTGQIIDSEITLVNGDSLSIINLRNRGIPADIFKVNIKRLDGVNTITADAQVDLPGIMDGMPIKMRKLRFNSNGLSGRVNPGTYSETYPAEELPTLDFATLGSQAIVTLEGLDVSFGENNSVGFSGKFIPLMFAHGDDTTKVQYAANWNNVERKFTFSFDFADGEVFDFGVGTFTPGGIGDNPAMQLTLSEQDFELLLSGEFRANQFGDDFTLGIEGLKITKNNVSAEAISKSEANPIRFKLFNSDFRIFDKDVNNKAIRFTYADNVLKLILSGDITLFGKADNKVTFSNFTIGTDGSFSIGQANFLNSDLVIVDNYISINNVGISNNKLAVGGWIKLPDPVGNDTQFDFGFNLDANGTITADNRIGNKIVLINEPQRIGNPAETEYDFWKAKFDLTYLALELNFANISNSSVQMVSDIYWDNNRNKRVSLGNKSDINSIVPGLEITFAGDVNWGSASVNGNFVNFDEDMFRVKVNTVQLTSDRNNNLTFGIGGEFGLNFDAVEGGLNLADFQFNKTGIVNIGRITGGTLTIEDVGSLTLNNIGYSDSQTRIWVKGGESPGAASGSARADSTQITVNNYLSFGGEITIDGFGAAGVDRFLTYSTDNSYTLLVRNAHFEIEGTMSASLDLLYSTGDAGFIIKAGGSADISDFNGSVVGKITKINNQVSWGFFIATEVRIDITPIVITGVGGGFFYNPNADDILAVKRLANVGESNGKIAVQGGKFAIFLFGQAAIVSDVLIYGRVLITVTDRQFMLDGRVVVLDMENKIEGEIHLMVQWSPTFEAEGEIAIDIDVARIVKGTGRVGFYVYSTDQWAIYGESEIKLFNYIESSSEYFVGNSGFMLGMSSSVNFDLWIIEVGAGIDVKVWYMPGKSWGAYAKAWVKAEILWGVAKAKGWLQCALLGSEGNVYLYGQAGLEIHVLFTDWSGSAWAKISNGEVDGGRGSDSDMDALIAEAMGQSEAAEREMNDMKTSIESRPPAVQTFSDEELLQIYSSLAEMGRKAKYGSNAEQAEAEEFFRLMREMEYRASTYIPAEYRSNYESTALPWIQRHVYEGYNAPNLVQYQNNKQSVDSLVTIYNDSRNNVIPLLEVGLETIQAIENSNLIAQANDPTANTNFATYSIDENGNYVVSGRPSMNIDEDLANSNKSNMQNSERADNDYKRRVAAELFKINNNISIIENSLVGEDGNSGVEGMATEYAALISKVSDAYKTEFKFSREMELWARAKKNQFNTDPALTSVARQMDAKANNLYSNAEWYVLMDLARLRVFKMNILLGNSQQVAFERDAEERRSWSDYHDKIATGEITENEYRSFAISRNAELGRQLWYDTPRAGLEAVIESSVSKIREINNNKAINIEDLGAEQIQFTRKINNLYNSLTNLSETKYDIIQQLISWEERFADPNKPPTFLNQLTAMKNELVAKMEVPTISSLTATNYDQGIYSTVPVIWNVQGGNRDKIKFLIDYSSRNPNINSAGYQAVGRAKWITLYYTPQPGQTTFGSSTLNLKARNQVGYVINRTINFTPTFSNRAHESIGDITINYTERDITPPYINPYLAYQDNFRLLESDPLKVKVFASDSSSMTASWIGSDTETGIQEYRYRFVQVRNPDENGIGNNNFGLGNLTINDNLIPNALQNANEQDNGPYANWTSNFGRNNIVLNDLNMQHNRYYQLQVVAKNGEGIYSEVIAGEKQFILADLTPPTIPNFPMSIQEFGDRLEDIDFNFGANSFTVNPLLPADNLPVNRVDKYLNVFDNSNAQIELSWNQSEDPESGVLKYEIQVANKRDESLVTNWKNVSRNTEILLNNNTTGLNEMLNFVDTFKVAVRAVNIAKRASKSSEKLVKINDLTPPTKPNVAASYTAVMNRALLVFNQHSQDLQTGVDHYEVAVGSRPNGEFDILSWSNPRTIPLRSVSYNGRYSVSLPESNINYIAVRAVNTDGMKGQFCYTGPFYQDSTPPERPSIDLNITNIQGRGKFLTISFSNILDNESGIKNVQYRLFKKVAGSDTWVSVVRWSEADNLNGASINLSSYDIVDNIDLKVEVKSLNNVDIYSATRSVNYRLPDSTPPLAPTIAITSGSVNKGPSGVSLRFGNISDPESGIKKIEYKIEKRTGISYSTISNWRSNGTRTTAAFMYSSYSLRAGDNIRISVKTYNNDGLVSEVTRETHILE